MMVRHSKTSTADRLELSGLTVYCVRRVGSMSELSHQFFHKNHWLVLRLSKNQLKMGRGQYLEPQEAQNNDLLLTRVFG